MRMPTADGRDRQCRPSAVVHERLLPSGLKIIAAILKTLVIERILHDLGLPAWARRAHLRAPRRRKRPTAI
jgi:hypothetical protein